MPTTRAQLSSTLLHFPEVAIPNDNALSCPALPVRKPVLCRLQQVARARTYPPTSIPGNPSTIRFVSRLTVTMRPIRSMM